MKWPELLTERPNLKSLFLKNSYEHGNFCHSASLLAEGKDIFAIWYAYPEKENLEGKIVLAKSSDEGESFGPGKVLFPQISKSQGNPVIFRTGPKLIVLFSLISETYWNDARIYWSTSLDEGSSWSEPVMLSEQKGLMVRHPPEEINGRWLLPLYDETTFTSHLYEINLDHFSISKYHSFEGSLIQPQIVRLKEGLEVYFRTAGDDFAIWHAAGSLDGSSWTRPIKTDLPCPKSGISAHAEGDGIVVTFNNTKGIFRTPLSLAKMSSARGQSNIYDLETANLEFSYPHSVFSNYKTHLIYTYNRKMLKYVKFDDLDKHFSFKDQIESVKGIHKGKNLFILASGPSLSDLDLKPLTRRLTMGLNRSFLKFPDTKYHCVMDARLFDDYPEEFSNTRMLFSLPTCPWGIRLNLLGTDGFSDDLTSGVYSGYTVSYYAIQLAVYMGFKKIIFLGLDLKHRDGDTHFFGKDFRSENHEQGEFQKMISMLDKASNFAKERGVEIYNCSSITDFEGFEKISYEDALKF